MRFSIPHRRRRVFSFFDFRSSFPVFPTSLKLRAKNFRNLDLRQLEATLVLFGEANVLRPHVLANVSDPHCKLESAGVAEIAADDVEAIRRPRRTMPKTLNSKVSYELGERCFLAEP